MLLLLCPREDAIKSLHMRQCLA